MNVDDTITCDLYIIFGDTCLRKDLDDLLSEVVNVRNFIDKWNLPRETGIELTIELLESVEHARILLTDDDAEAEVKDATTCSGRSECFNIMAQEAALWASCQHLDCSLLVSNSSE